MLVLTRKMNQVIKLGDNITITVVRTSNGSVKLGIEAPRAIYIARAECNEASKTTPMEPRAV